MILFIKILLHQMALPKCIYAKLYKIMNYQTYILLEIVKCFLIHYLVIYFLVVYFIKLMYLFHYFIHLKTYCVYTVYQIYIMYNTS